MNDNEYFSRYFLPGQREYLRNKRIKTFLIGFFIAAFIFTGLGYGWRMKQTDQKYQDEIVKITSKYLDARNRIADLETRFGIIRGKNRGHK